MFADGGYAGEELATALKDQGDWVLEIIKRSDTAKRRITFRCDESNRPNLRAPK